VRRESITEAAGRLQQGGFIRYRRGHIDVLDRNGLQSRACECYAAIKNEVNRLLPGTASRQRGVAAPEGGPPYAANTTQIAGIVAASAAAN
jgi:hypothetical protein